MIKTTILVADSHPIFREAVVQLLQKQDDFDVIAQAADGEEVVKLAKELSPEIVVMDTEMPKIDGLEATRQIKSNNPEAVILILTIHDDEGYMAALLDAGVAGYLLKNVYGTELVQAVRTVRIGELVIDSGLARKVFRNFSIKPKQLVRRSAGERLALSTAGVVK